MAINAVSIVLEDNDFNQTFLALLSSIKDVLKYYPDLTFDNLSKIIVSGVEFHYLAFQLRNNHGKSGYGDSKQTVLYLVSNMKILYNQEAINDALTVSHDGGAWFLDVYQEQVMSY